MDGSESAPAYGGADCSTSGHDVAIQQDCQSAIPRTMHLSAAGASQDPAISSPKLCDEDGEVAASGACPNADKPGVYLGGDPIQIPSPYNAGEQQAWRTRSYDLANWTMAHLVNRDDAYGLYRRLDQRQHGPVMTMSREVTLDLLARHYQGVGVDHLIAVHAISLGNQCRWVVADLDHHGDPDAAIRERNLAAGIDAYEMFRRWGFQPLLIETNGRGSLHLWLLFDRPMSSEKNHEFGRFIRTRSPWTKLPQLPEIFPKQARLTPKVRFGSMVRLPGRHHSLAFWSRVWDGKAWVRSLKAIEAILATRPQSIEPIERILAPGGPAPSGRKKARSGDPVRLVLNRLHGVTRCTGYWMAICPAHADGTPSLSIRRGVDGRVLLHCHAGCDIEAILEKLGLWFPDLFSKRRSGHRRDDRHYFRPTIRPPEIRIQLAMESARTITSAELEELASLLGLPVEALKALEVGWNRQYWPHDTWALPERNAAGQVIGICCRGRDGSKRMMQRSQRGLYLPDGWQDRPGPVFVPEGFSDAAALTSMGLAAAGRPSCTGGVQHLIELFRRVDREIVVLGDNDQRPDGSWPGKVGAVKVALALQEQLGRSVKYTMPPEGFKDVREQITSGRWA